MYTVIEHFVFLVEWAHLWLKCDVKFFYRGHNFLRLGKTFGLVDLFPTDSVLDFFCLEAFSESCLGVLSGKSWYDE
jgi:hypothetical protein